MTYAQAEQALRAAFAAAWSSSPVAYQNVPFVPTPGTAYAAFGVQEIPSELVSSGVPGGRRVRRPLLVTVDIRVPVDTGPAAGRGLADAVVDIFELKAVAGVDFRTADVTTVGPDGGAWFRWRVTVEGYFDTFR